MSSGEKAMSLAMGQAVRRLRLKKGWSQERLAREVEVSRETIRRAEGQVQKIVTLGMYERIAQALDKELVDLLPTRDKVRALRETGTDWYSQPGFMQDVSPSQLVATG